jgi:hypothetical protein
LTPQEPKPNQPRSIQKIKFISDTNPIILKSPEKSPQSKILEFSEQSAYFSKFHSPKPQGTKFFLPSFFKPNSEKPVQLAKSLEAS